MYRVTCYCGKTEFYRTEIMKSWTNRKCKKCKSNLIVYQNETLFLNFNNKKERDLNRKKRPIKPMKQIPSVFNQVPFNPIPLLPQPMFLQMPFVPVQTPVKIDVFMGYHGPNGQMYMMTPIENYPKDMEIDEVKQEKHEFEFNESI